MNASQEQRCRECGARMTGELPDGLCPGCMMKLAIEPSPSEPAMPAAAIGEPAETVEASLGAAQPSSLIATADRQDRQHELESGQEYGDYTIVRRLGRGGMGTVYEADHRPSGRRVALKILSHSLDNSQARARFLREGRLAASINHPNSVYVYGTEQIDQTPTISMELIRGGTLQQWVRDKGSLSVPVAVDAVLQIIDGLEAADRKGVLHRDVKPANCFIDPTGTIKIGDFGLSVSTGPRDDSLTNVTREGVFLGTPAFASPEQLRGEPLDRRSDIYSVGVTLFYLLTGRAPFTGDNMVQLLATVLDKQPPSVRSLREDVPEELDSIIQVCLQKSAGQRFADYDSLRESLLPHSSLKPMPAPLATRVIAGFVDFLTQNVIAMVCVFTFQFLFYGHVIVLPQVGVDHAMYNVITTISVIFVTMMYYTITEWRWGRTLGKYLLELRVVDSRQNPAGEQRISARQAITRAGIYSIVPSIPSLCYSIAVRGMTIEMIMNHSIQWYGLAATMAYYLLVFGLFITARPRNGFAAVHDLASGTRVVCKPKLRSQPADAGEAESFSAGKHDKKIGPYHVLDLLWDNGDRRLILGYDAKLLRRVWLHVQPAGAPEVETAHRNLARVHRLRWLGAQRNEAASWDCYEAPTGKSLKQWLKDGLRWEAAIATLRQLAGELHMACEDQTLPAQLSLDRIWITDEETLKLLDFAEQDSAPPLVAFADAPSDPQAVAMSYFRQVATFVYDNTPILVKDLPEEAAMPLGVHESLATVAQAATLEEAAIQLDQLAAAPSINVKRRKNWLLAASLAVPVLMCFSTLMASIAIDQQKAQMPRLGELGQLSMSLNFELNMPGDEEQRERVDALTTHIAANYADVINDPHQMNSFYGMTVVPANLREHLHEAIQQTPTDEQTAKATAMVDEILEDQKGKFFPAEVIFFSFRALPLICSVSWLELIWLPSLFTALFFGGGALLWASGLCLVDRSGRRAWRPRVFVRMLIGGLPVMVIAFGHLVSSAASHSPIGPALVWGLGAAIIVLAIVFRNRQIHDRIAGTYLVAR